MWDEIIDKVEGGKFMDKEQQRHDRDYFKKLS